MFRLVQDLPGLTASSLTEGLSKLRYVKAAEDAERAAGFVAPVDSEEDVLAYEVDGAFLIAFKEESKILPGSVIRERVDELIADIETQQNRRVGKKETKELRERAVSELLKKAFSRCKTTYAFIDTKSSVLWIDASSRAKAGDLVECLRRTVEGFACSPLKVNGSASAIMTAWLQSGEAPEGWSIEEDATLIENENTGGKISIRRQSLLKDEVVNHLNNGMQVESMTLTWNDKIFLRLSDELLVKGILPLDLIKTKMMESESETQLERLQADLNIMMGEFRLMLEDITSMFGGETGRQYDLVTKAEVDADDLYPVAVQLVQAEQRASISYVQRNLRIGYNRAARLIEKMEAEGIVSTMHADGSRQVLQVTH